MTAREHPARPTAREWAEAIWLTELMGGNDSPGTTTVAVGGDREMPGEGVPPEAPPVPGEAPRSEPGSEPGNEPGNDPTPSGSGGTGPAAPEAPSADLPQFSYTLGTGRTGAREVLPGALREPRRLAQALRPFNRRLPGGSRNRVLDEEATAVWAAETGQWNPVLTRLPGRWFEVALVVERSLSMEVWQPVARAFADLLCRQGAFRDVRIWSLDTRDGKRALLRSGDGGLAHSPAELFHPEGRRIVLVMSDCVGDAWAGGPVPRLLHTWGQRAPVAVLQPLPIRMWDLCAAAPRDLRVRAPLPGLPNSRLELLRYGRWGRPSDSGPADPLPVPVLELELNWFAGWARMVTGGGLPWIDAAVLLVNEEGLTAGCPTWQERQAPVPPDLTVRRFLQNASSAARRLAARLAMVPLRPEVVAAVRRDTASASGPLPFAEILLRGLLELRTVSDPGGERHVFEFQDGVRSQLLRGMGRTELLRTLQEMYKLAREATGARSDLLLRTLIGSGGDDADSPTSLDRELLDATGPALTALGPPYVQVQKPPVIRGGGDDADSPTSLDRELVHARFGPVTTGERLPARDGPTDDGSRDPGAQSRNAASSDRSEPPYSSMPPSTQEAARMASDTQTGGVAAESSRGPGGDSAALTDPVSKTAVHSPRSVPMPNPHFAGREAELAELHRQLNSNTRAAVLPRALYGLGGVGKTQLALKYVELHRHEYDRVWWIDAEQPAVIRAQLAMLAPELKLMVDGQSDDPVEHVLDALASGTPYRRWLLVFDNAGQPPMVTPYIPPPIGGPDRVGHVLITSRHAGWSDRLNATRVSVFSRAESVEFLQARAPWTSPQDADRLATLLGDLPLALEQCAALQRQTGIGTEEFLTILDQRQTEVLAEGVDSITAPVATVWRASVESLTRQTPGALELLRLLAFFGPEPVALNFLHDARMLPLPSALARLARDPLARGRVIQAVNEYSLLELDNAAGTVRMHRLLRSVLQGEMTEREQRETRHLVHEVIAAHDPGDANQSENWARYAEILPHLEPSGLLRSDTRYLRDTALNILAYLTASGQARGAAELGERISSEWRSFLGADDLQTLLTYWRRASAHWHLAEFDMSLELSEEGLRRLRATVGDDHQHTITTAGLLAANLRAAGRFTDALELDEDAYRRSVDQYRADDPFVLRATHNYAVSLRVNGRYDEALELDSRVHRDHLASSGPTALFTLFAINNVARDLRECGRYAEALRLQEDTVAAYRTHYGDNNPNTLRAIKNLAVTCRKAGKFARGRELAEEALERYRTVLGPKHVDTLAAATNLANDLRLTGDREAAERQGAQAFEDYRTVLGPDHPLTYVAAVNYAAALRATGKFPQALHLDRTSAAGLREAFHEDHPWLLMVEINLATGLAAAGDLEAAHEQDERCARLLADRYGDSHPMTLAALRNLALDLGTRGEEEQGAELLASVVSSCLRTLGPHHPDTRASQDGQRAECDIEPPPL